jgi:outer membrane lipoprotein-sorting protein
MNRPANRLMDRSARPTAPTRAAFLAFASSLALLASAAAALAPTAGAAEDPAARGLQIATEADRRDQGFGDSTVSLRMTLRNKQGDSSVRELRTRTLEVAGDGDKSLITFDTPADVKGTALLSFTHKRGPDDQWLFLPALKRVKRIAADNKAGPFMGSEFAYEDLASQEVEKYTYKHLRDEAVDGVPMFVIERYPVDPKSGYTRQVVWLDQAEHRVHKVDYYDRKQSLSKTLTAKGFKQYLGKHWRPAEMTMVNHQTGKSTVLEFRDFQFRSGLKDKDFDQNALQNAK